MFCNRAKEFLSQHGIAYAERDVSKDETAVAELERRGFMTTPVILVDDEAVVGFDQKKLAALLGL